MFEPTCVLCPVYHPDAEANVPDHSQTCPSCRRRLERDRASVRALYLRLLEVEDEIADTRLGDRIVWHSDNSVSRLTDVPRDPIAALMPMAPTPGRSRKPSVSGSKERQLPINVNRIDLLAPGKPWEIHDVYGDQVGVLSVATVLGRWAEHWLLTYWEGVLHASRDALTLLDWMGGYRLEFICDREPDLPRFAQDLALLRSQLRSELGDTAPKPAVMWGVPCKRCDRVSTLKLDPDDEHHYRECSMDDCGLLMTEDEYLAWVLVVVERAQGTKVTEREAVLADVGAE